MGQRVRRRQLMRLPELGQAMRTDARGAMQPFSWHAPDQSRYRQGRTLVVGTLMAVSLLACSVTIPHRSDQLYDDEIATLFKELVPASSGLSRCNTGGDQAACHAATATMVDLLTRHAERIQRLADDSSRTAERPSLGAILQALDALRNAYQGRNLGIERQSNEQFAAGNAMVATGASALEQARLVWVGEVDKGSR